MAVSQSVLNKEKNKRIEKNPFSKKTDPFFSKNKRAGHIKMDSIIAMGVRSLPVERLRKPSKKLPQ